MGVGGMGIGGSRMRIGAGWFGLGLAAAVGVEDEGLGGDAHGDGLADLLDETVDDGCRGFARLLPTAALRCHFSTVCLTFHNSYKVTTRPILCTDPIGEEEE